MPFNKGDFTQQGVAGHVNANIRLNEKRLVNIDLTSNEDAEGCTIAGAVTDLLNNEVYPVGAGVSGNIEITENGENISVAPYATATVNVSGGGGIATVAITFINNTGITHDISEGHINNTAPANVIKNTAITLPIQGEYTIYTPIYQADIENGYRYESVLYLEQLQGYAINASNAVNCTYNYGSMLGTHMITVTDITEPCSITLTISESIG